VGEVLAFDSKSLMSLWAWVARQITVGKRGGSHGGSAECVGLGRVELWIGEGGVSKNRRLRIARTRRPRPYYSISASAGCVWTGGGFLANLYRGVGEMWMNALLVL